MGSKGEGDQGNKVREMGSGDRLLTWAEMMNEQVIHHHLVTMSLSATWHCDVALPHHACCVGVCCAPCGWWMVMVIGDGVGTVDRHCGQWWWLGKSGVVC